MMVLIAMAHNLVKSGGFTKSPAFILEGNFQEINVAGPLLEFGQSHIMENVELTDVRKRSVNKKV